MSIHPAAVAAWVGVVRPRLAAAGVACVHGVAGLLVAWSRIDLVGLAGCIAISTVGFGIHARSVSVARGTGRRRRAIAVVEIAVASGSVAIIASSLRVSGVVVTCEMHQSIQYKIKVAGMLRSEERMRNRRAPRSTRSLPLPPASPGHPSAKVCSQCNRLTGDTSPMLSTLS